MLAQKSEWLRLTRELGFPGRFEQFFTACDVIIKSYEGELRTDSNELLALPCIGHYGSDAIRCFGLNENRYLVDTNTLRVGSRLTGYHIK